MRRIRGFTLLETMLVLLLLGVTSGLVMLSFPADEKPLAQRRRSGAGEPGAVRSAGRRRAAAER